MRVREIRRISRADCADLLLRVHYAKRWPSITYAFGLFVGGNLCGAVTYGTPPSAPLRSGVAGADYISNVLELNRLALYENIKNDASWLISASLAALKVAGNFIVVSFADTSHGHVGTVYQAAGFSYRGLSAKRTDWKVKGLEHLHGQTIADKFRGVADRAAAIRAMYGDDFYLSPRPRKHRYVKILGTKGFCAAASKSMKYHEEPYPRKVA